MSLQNATTYRIIRTIFSSMQRIKEVYNGFKKGFRDRYNDEST